ncbi:ubiquinol-cytochrome c reductase cytochrome b subunit [Prauserella shujinwangii]|uniref:Cytochrome bc1 complex cytochrome b subunit n=1 Tax=Prauserella shujinwangii TaxID=1453103 RepID=A0A2T0LKR1_9PSEU|nr:cytochrome bc complex cytochrome b subunit [Prauserella shujinwangii]PRX43423.1 ubiquinol-cytochrome c reductase cytochrome b subunit [Prauserella shujinwangii]
MVGVTRFADALDERFKAAKGVRPRANKVFPEHFSFLFGEIALYSLVVLVISGAYLALFFDPSMAEVTYRGGYLPMHEVEMSRAYETAVQLSFEVRGGLLVRQIHHWAALVFIAAILVHLLRIFFTGAFRKPREGNWLIGLFLLLLGLAEGYVGYSLPDDLLSGLGVRIMSGMALSIPVVGTWLQWMVFDGEYIGDLIIPRFFTLHVFVIPALLLALVAVHLAAVWYQEHTQFPGKRKTETNEVGTRTVPAFAMKSTGLAAAVTAVLIGMGGLLQINPIFNYGPYEASHSSLNAQPDWYLLWVEGAMRLFPSAELVLGDYRVPAVFWPAVAMPFGVFALLFAYPFLERRVTRDNAAHNLLQRPRDNPGRTGFGMMLLSFYTLLTVAGTDDVMAFIFDVPVETLVWTFRIAVLAVPPLAFVVTYLSCQRLQRADRDVLLRGAHTGVLEPRPGGYYVEVRQRLHTDGDERTRPRYTGARLPSLPAELDRLPADEREAPAGQNQRGGGEA